MADEYEVIGFSPLQFIKFALALINEVVDWLTAFLNLSGIWAVLVFVFNLITLILIFGLNTLTEGFSLSALVCGWQQGILLILEHVPIIGDIIPGFLLYLLVGGKRRKKGPQEVTIKPPEKTPVPVKP